MMTEVRIAQVLAALLPSFLTGILASKYFDWWHLC